MDEPSGFVFHYKYIEKGCRIKMEEKKTLLTYAGLTKLEEELHDLKVNKRKEVAEKIKEAREQGDLSENAEYDEAKNEQAILEAQIKEIQYTLDNCEVVDDDSISLDEVGLGSTIKLKNFQSGKVETWQIVSSNEANFAEHKDFRRLSDRKS